MENSAPQAQEPDAPPAAGDWQKKPGQSQLYLLPHQSPEGFPAKRDTGTNSFFVTFFRGC